MEKGEIKDDDLENIWSSFSDKERKVIDLDYRKAVKAKLRVTFEGLQSEFNKEVRNRAAEARKRLKELGEYLGIEEV